MSVDAGLSCLKALGEAWRGDWSQFDGRQLRAELEDVADIIRAESNGDDVTGAVASFYAVNDICPTCQSWTEHCRCGRAA